MIPFRRRLPSMRDFAWRSPASCGWQWLRYADARRSVSPSSSSEDDVRRTLARANVEHSQNVGDDSGQRWPAPPAQSGACGRRPAIAPAAKLIATSRRRRESRARLHLARSPAAGGRETIRKARVWCPRSQFMEEEIINRRWTDSCGMNRSPRSMGLDDCEKC